MPNPMFDEMAGSCSPASKHRRKKLKSCPHECCSSLAGAPASENEQQQTPEQPSLSKAASPSPQRALRPLNLTASFTPPAATGAISVAPLPTAPSPPPPPPSAGGDVRSTLVLLRDEGYLQISDKHLEKVVAGGRFSVEQLLDMHSPNQPGGLLQLAEGGDASDHHHSIVLFTPTDCDPELGVLSVSFVGRCACGEGDRQDPLECASVLASLADGLSGSIFSSGVGLYLDKVRKLGSFEALSILLPAVGEPAAGTRVNSSVGCFAALVTGLLETLSTAAPRQAVMTCTGETFLPLCRDCDLERYDSITKPYLNRLIASELRNRGLSLRGMGLLVPFSKQGRTDKAGTTGVLHLDAAKPGDAPLMNLGCEQLIVGNLGHVGWLLKRVFDKSGVISVAHIKEYADAAAAAVGMALGLGALDGTRLLLHLLAAPLNPALAATTAAKKKAPTFLAQLESSAAKGEKQEMLKLAHQFLAFGSFSPIFGGRGGHVRARFERSAAEATAALDGRSLTVWCPHQLDERRAAHLRKSLPYGSQVRFRDTSETLPRHFRDTSRHVSPNITSRIVAQAEMLSTTYFCWPVVVAPDGWDPAEAEESLLVQAGELTYISASQLSGLLYTPDVTPPDTATLFALRSLGPLLLDEAARWGRKHPTVAQGRMSEADRLAAGREPRKAPMSEADRLAAGREPRMTEADRLAAGREPRKAPMSEADRLAAGREPRKAPMSEADRLAAGREPRKARMSEADRLAAGREPRKAPMSEADRLAAGREPRKARMSEADRLAAGREPRAARKPTQSDPATARYICPECDKPGEALVLRVRQGGEYNKVQVRADHAACTAGGSSRRPSCWAIRDGCFTFVGMTGHHLVPLTRLSRPSDGAEAAAAKQHCVDNCRHGRSDVGSVMIACDGCDDWFHPACVGMTIKQAAALKSYVCGQCQL
ncbi:hypothetical protein EMIHUDRAFT_107169 [Emiliania huxleyi CCMP1516]|uniref:PHD-type domain-containing protein n=2 Tax=Emiliania huxleyi TaxID=2903 RepID=A0A0D3I3C8_EMIH1|nr:hypothetical protein EMIHUDRAFT_107169 [Emiliania huxleyi CCMP1516]EOD05763.1 hypothetical protein EMIHUDRAFT_107169 [Emiliania huxleyi CCMP1516]|eukprot:XP_005758192.1 hypothetical protein EMIHUDRAFT_107169 [Emiliania huxleyi CCMP1516]